MKKLSIMYAEKAAEATEESERFRLSILSENAFIAERNTADLKKAIIIGATAATAATAATIVACNVMSKNNDKATD